MLLSLLAGVQPNGAVSSNKTHTIMGYGSVDRRPDTFSSSYLVSHCFGPIAQGDNSQGPLARVWQVRVDGNYIRVRRQADDFVSWDPETTLFHAYGLKAIEMDAAFDQAGRIFVCIERPTGADDASEIWAYYFNPLISAFNLEKLGRGRNPRAILDDFRDTINADVLCFYMNDDSNRMAYRQQRDRYQTEYVLSYSSSGVPPDPTLGPIVGLNYEEGGVAVEVTGAMAPPYPHFGTTLGSHQIDQNGQFSYQMVLKFSEPITEFTATMYYPVSPRSGGTGMAMYAVKDESSFIGSGGDTFVALNHINFDDVHGSTKTLLTGGEPYTYVVIESRLRNVPEFGQFNRSPTFGNMTYVTLRDPTVPQPIPITSQNRYIEDVYKAIDSRLHVLYSERNIVTGRYTLKHWESVIYPQFTDADGYTAPGLVPQDTSEFKQVLLAIRPDDNPSVDPSPVGYNDTDNYTALGLTPLPISTLQGSQIPIVLDPTEGSYTAINPSPQSGSLALVLLQHVLFDVDTYTAIGVGPQAAGSSLVFAQIQHTLFDTDNYQGVGVAPIAAGSSLA